MGWRLSRAVSTQAEAEADAFFSPGIVVVQFARTAEKQKINDDVVLTA